MSSRGGGTEYEYDPRIRNCEDGISAAVILNGRSAAAAATDDDDEMKVLVRSARNTSNKMAVDSIGITMSCILGIARQKQEQAARGGVGDGVGDRGRGGRMVCENL